jgi:hypothetical protein
MARSETEGLNVTIQQLRDTLHATPFRPFIIHIADGRAIPVRHRDFVSQSPSGRTIIVQYGNDEHSIIDLLLVTELEIRNGSIRRKRRAN